MYFRWPFAQRNALAGLVMPRETDALLAPWIRHWPNLVTALVEGGPDSVASHLYEMLSWMGLHYAVEPSGGDRHSQLVRSPAQVVATDHRGTCLDLALLFASCLEANRVHPIVVILEGHALVAFWKHSSLDQPPPFGRYVDSSDEAEPAIIAADTLCVLLAREEIVPVECTGFALCGSPVTLDPSSESRLRTRKPPTDNISTMGQPRSDPDSRDKLIEYVDAKVLGATQFRPSTIRFGVCIATAREEGIDARTHRDPVALDGEPRFQLSALPQIAGSPSSEAGLTSSSAVTLPPSRSPLRARQRAGLRAGIRQNQAGWKKFLGVAVLLSLIPIGLLCWRLLHPFFSSPNDHLYGRVQAASLARVRVHLVNDRDEPNPIARGGVDSTNGNFGLRFDRSPSHQPRWLVVTAPGCLPQHYPLGPAQTSPNERFAVKFVCTPRGTQ